MQGSWQKRARFWMSFPIALCGDVERVEEASGVEGGCAGNARLTRVRTRLAQKQRGIHRGFRRGC